MKACSQREVGRSFLGMPCLRQNCRLVWKLGQNRWAKSPPCLETNPRFYITRWHRGRILVKRGAPYLSPINITPSGNSASGPKCDYAKAGKNGTFWKSLHLAFERELKVSHLAPRPEVGICSRLAAPKLQGTWREIWP